jgi:hypothetical protein
VVLNRSCAAALIGVAAATASIAAAAPAMAATGHHTSAAHASTGATAHTSPSKGFTSSGGPHPRVPQTPSDDPTHRTVLGTTDVAGKPPGITQGPCRLLLRPMVHRSCRR